MHPGPVGPRDSPEPLELVGHRELLERPGFGVPVESDRLGSAGPREPVGPQDSLGRLDFREPAGHQVQLVFKGHPALRAQPESVERLVPRAQLACREHLELQG